MHNTWSRRCYRSGRSELAPGCCSRPRTPFGWSCAAVAATGRCLIWAVDPVPALCEMVTSLHTMTTRRVDPFDPAVLTVGRLSAGTAENVIADTARLGATIRTFSAGTRHRLITGIESVCRGVAAAHGVEVDIVMQRDCAATVNNPAEAARVSRVAHAVLGPGRFVEVPHPIPGSEDFSFVLEQVRERSSRSAPHPRAST